ncbi:trehalose-6-phosphate synthase, partial [Ochrobactrum sp. MR34]|nr:trehalose-6-phosphate synthase [Ochrobactrum sp. MR34]
NIAIPLGENRFKTGSHEFKVGKFGIGIETDKFTDTAQRSEKSALVRRMRESMTGRDLIIGVDRLDYSKGITNRIEAFEHFVQNNPEYK